LLYASKVAKDNGLDNVKLIYGDTTSPDDVAKLPDDYFDVILSQRGPNMNEFLVKKLKEEGIFIQEYVGHFDVYPLKEIFGRRNYSPYDFYGVEAIICRYAEIELFPVSIKEYFYNEYYADIEHLKSYLVQQQGANLSNWRLPNRPYEEDLDRVSLELYAKYNMTSKGIRLMRHRNIFVFRKTKVSYYPVDSIKLFKHQP